MSGRAIWIWVGVGVLLAGFVALRMWEEVGESFAKSRLSIYYRELQRQGESFDFREYLPEKAADASNGGAEASAAAVEAVRIAKENGLKLVTYGHAQPGPGPIYHLREAARRKVNTEWQDVSWDQLNEELAPLRPSLDRLKEATRQPALSYDLDYRKGLGMDLGPTRDLLSVAQYLGMENLLLLRDGKSQQALENIRTMLSLSRMVQEQHSFICQLVAVSILSIAQASTWEMLQSPKVTTEELAALQEAWVATRPLRKLVETLRMERALGLMVFYLKFEQLYPRNTEWLHLWPKYQVWRAFFRKTDEYQYVRDIQRVIDRLKGRTRADWQDILSVSAATNDKLNKAGVSLMMSKLMNSSLHGSLEKMASTQTLRNMTITAIALRRYQLEHDGALPEKLGELRPGYLKAVPHDAIGGGSFVYRREGDGYVLYSKGRNGRDDGASTVSATEKPARGFMDCEDIIWPQIGEIDKTGATR